MLKPRKREPTWYAADLATRHCIIGAKVVRPWLPTRLDHRQGVPFGRGRWVWLKLVEKQRIDHFLPAANVGFEYNRFIAWDRRF